MKKILFFAAAAVAVMTSCSSSDDVVAEQAPVNPGNQEIAESRVAIQLGATNNVASAAVRGTGTVGTTDAATNKWGGQNFNVYMFKHGTIEDTIYNNTVFYAGIATGKLTPDIFNGVGSLPAITSDSVSYIRPKNDTVKYYPAQGAYDFVAYRLDSAWTANPVKGASTWTRDFTIDGSQDIMVAAATPEADSIAAVLAYLQTSNPSATTADAEKRFFSSFTARRGNIPTLEFKHLLTRLTFNVIPGTAKAVEAGSGVVVDSIKVISDVDGTLTFAPADAQGITWNTPATKDTLTLKERATAGSDYLDSLNLKKLTPYSLIGKTVGTGESIGEALLVAPATDYRVIVYVSQELPILYSVPATTEKHVYAIPTTISLSSGDFEAAKSYIVNITVNGAQDIVLKASLTKWVEGETINKDPENEDFE